MEKFIPYEKLSKKEKRKVDATKRNTWDNLNPVTRKPQNSKTYNRRKSQNWKRGLPPTALRLFTIGSFVFQKLCNLIDNFWMPCIRIYYPFMPHRKFGP